MTIIRGDAETGATNTRLLAIEWHLSLVCCVIGCDGIITTIIRLPKCTYTLCEEHYQAGNVPEGTTLHIQLAPKGA